MIKKLIGVLAYATTSSAISAELFNDGTNSLTIGGFVDFALYSEELRTIGGQVVRDGQRTDIGGSRIHFDFRHQATEALELQFMSEFFVHYLNGDAERSDLFSNRLGYIGLTHTRWGQLRIGKQWSAVNDVIGINDNIFLHDPDASPVYQIRDGGLHGTGRLDKGIVYRTELGQWSFGAQYGTEQSASLPGYAGGQPNTQQATRDWNYGVAASYRFNNGWRAGAAYTETQFSADSLHDYAGITRGTTEKAMIAAINLSYLNAGLNLSLTLIPVGENAYMSGWNGFGAQDSSVEHPLSTSGVLGDAGGADLLLSYRSGKLEPYAYLSAVKFADNERNRQRGIGWDGNFDRSLVSIGLMYHVSEAFIVGAGVRHANFEDNPQGVKEDSDIGIKLRLFY